MRKNILLIGFFLATISCSYKELHSGIYVCEDKGSSIFVDSVKFRYLERSGDVQSTLCSGKLTYSNDSIVFTTDLREGKLQFCEKVEVGLQKSKNTFVFRDKKYTYLKGSVSY